jgi:hypothetical protein
MKWVKAETEKRKNQDQSKSLIKLNSFFSVSLKRRKKLME